MAVIVDLNHHASYLHWRFIVLSVPNAIVIGLLFVAFAIAVAVPLPGRTREEDDR